MQKRPISIAIIAWFLGITALISIYSVATMGSNPLIAKMLEKMPVSLQFLQIWSSIGIVITLACAYAIWKGRPGGRGRAVRRGARGPGAGRFRCRRRRPA